MGGQREREKASDRQKEIQRESEPCLESGQSLASGSTPNFRFWQRAKANAEITLICSVARKVKSLFECVAPLSSPLPFSLFLSIFLLVFTAGAKFDMRICVALVFWLTSKKSFCLGIVNKQTFLSTSCHAHTRMVGGRQGCLCVCVCSFHEIFGACSVFHFVAATKKARKRFVCLPSNRK